MDRVTFAAGIAGLVLAGAGAAAHPASAAIEPPPEPPSDVVFTCTGLAQNYQVPDSVRQLWVDARGASGGDGLGSGGNGARVVGVVAVTPGEVLQVNVGCRGGDGPVSSGAGGAGGFNGGAAGAGGTAALNFHGGGGGGGASDIRRGGALVRVIVAGGGGGGGGGDDAVAFTAGNGGSSGKTGTPGGDAPGGGTGGGGGQTGAGGAAGTNSPLGTPAPTAGGPGSGGTGGSSGDVVRTGGGGGAGGYFGGGGGGGSGDMELSAWYQGGGGGGGSSFGPAGASFGSGMSSGNGVIVIQPVHGCGSGLPGPFPDVPGTHTFCADITWAVDQGIAQGYLDGGFHPADSVSRQAMAAFLYRYLAEPPFVVPAEPTFPDVGTTSPFFLEVEWARSVGLMDGYLDGTFKPTNKVSRQAMAALLYRLAGEPKFEVPAAATFSDVTLAHPFSTEIEWTAKFGIVGGYADGTFKPAAVVTRQATTAFFHRTFPPT